MALSLAKKRCERICFFSCKAGFTLTVRKCFHWWLFPFVIRITKNSVKMTSGHGSLSGWKANMIPKLHGLVGENSAKAEFQFYVWSQMFGPEPIWMKTHCFSSPKCFLLLLLLLLLLVLVFVNVLLNFQVQIMGVVLHVSSVLPGARSVTLGLKYPFHSPLSSCCSTPSTTLIQAFMNKHKELKVLCLPQTHRLLFTTLL